MPGEHVRLAPGEAIDLSRFFAGPWRQLTRQIIQPDNLVHLGDGDSETVVYVVQGRGRLEAGTNVVDLESGSAVTLLKGSSALLEAFEPLEVVITVVGA